MLGLVVYSGVIQSALGWSNQPKGSKMITAWTHDDLLVNLKDEVNEVKEFYNVPSLDHVPDFELTTVKYAQLGDLVPLGKGRVGIVFDRVENRGVVEFAIVGSTLRVVMKRISL